MSSLDLPVSEKVIGGLTYRVKPLSTRVSLQVMTRVLRMAAPGFGDVTSLAQAASAVGELLAGIASSLDESTVLFVVEAFAAVSQVELANGRLGLATHLDDHFRGKPVEMFEWLAFAAEVSFGPLAVAARAKAPKPDAKPSFGAPPASPPAAAG